jgi:hypothetical protein
MATEIKTAKTVKIKIPKTRDNLDDVYVAVNGRSALIKRGEYVEVRECFAEVLQHQEEMISEAMAYEEAAKANA